MIQMQRRNSCLTFVEASPAEAPPAACSSRARPEETWLVSGVILADVF